ncbi:MAG TPA: glycosyltransferase family 2 protein [Capillibacterium sp.]
MKTAAVIPAYNEAKNIGRVIAPLLLSPELAEVIVVSDGSTDETAAVARAMGAHVIELPVNRGKGAAVMAGVHATTAEVILLLDADLVGLTPRHIEALLAPVLARQAEMTVGYFTGGRLATDLSQQITPCLNGQRAVRRDMLTALPALAGSRYGLEIVMNRYARLHRWKVAWVALPNLSQVMKEEKVGLLRGLTARFRMYWQILKVLLAVRLP